MRFLIMLEQTETGFAVQSPDLAIATYGETIEAARRAARDPLFSGLPRYHRNMEGLFVGAKTPTVRGSLKLSRNRRQGGHSVGLPRVLDQPLRRTVMSNSEGAGTPAAIGVAAILAGVGPRYAFIAKSYKVLTL